MTISSQHLTITSMKAKDRTTKGLKPKDRKLATVAPKTRKAVLTANQWQNSPKQSAFMEQWLDPRSPNFGNAHRSALAVGFNERYAAQIASPSVGNQWIQEYTKRLNLTDEHIRQGIQQIAIQADESRSPDDTRLKAYETLARISGLLDSNRGNTLNVTVVQPILGGESIKQSTPVRDTTTTVEATVVDI